MLRHINLDSYADRIENSTFKVLRERRHITRDLGGKSSTKDYTRAIISNL